MSAISLTNIPSSVPVTSSSNYFKERRAEVQQLNEALKAGDITSAQQDYNNLVALGKNSLKRDNPFLRSDRGQDFNAIGSALQSGDISGARQAFAELESTYKAPPASAGAAKRSVNVVA